MSSMNKDVFFLLTHNQYQNHIITVYCVLELKFIMWNPSKKEKDLAKIVNYLECIISFQYHI